MLRISRRLVESLSSILNRSDVGARPDDAVLRYDDDAVADVIAVAVGLVDAAFVDQLRPVADPRVLVDDDAVEHDVSADSKAWMFAANRRVVVCLVEVGAEQDRPPDRGPVLDVGADA